MTTFATTRHTTTRSRHGHRHAQGFCTVCGSNWPCWAARIEDAKVAALRTSSSIGLPRC
jgi:hypothetical protein